MDLINLGKEGRENEERLPLDIVPILVALFKNCRSILDPTFAHTFVSDVRKSVF